MREENLEDVNLLARESLSSSKSLVSCIFISYNIVVLETGDKCIKKNASFQDKVNTPKINVYKLLITS